MSDSKGFYPPKDNYRIIGTVVGPDGQTIDLIDRVEYDKLHLKYEKMKAALEFYADENNWEWTTQPSTYDGCGLSDLDRQKEIAVGYYQVGGKRAREALKGIE
jgi:hypothetical protein